MNNGKNLVCWPKNYSLNKGKKNPISRFSEESLGGLKQYSSFHSRPLSLFLRWTLLVGYPLHMFSWESREHTQWASKLSKLQWTHLFHTIQDCSFLPPCLKPLPVFPYDLDESFNFSDSLMLIDINTNLILICSHCVSYFKMKYALYDRMGNTFSLSFLSLNCWLWYILTLNKTHLCFIFSLNLYCRLCTQVFFFF